MKVKVTDALGNRARASNLPVVSMSAVSSVGNLVPQSALGNSILGNLITFDATAGTNPLHRKTNG